MNKSFYNRILSSIILMPSTFFFIIKGSFFFYFFLFICCLLSLKEWKNMSFQKKYYYPGIIFLLFSILSAFFLRTTDEDGLFSFLYVILICIFSDLGGYFVGNLVKGPKLTKISPKKTYSGFIGGFIFSLLSIYLYLLIINKFYEQNEIFDTTTVIIVLIISTVSQLGDLTISYFKRKSNIKDTGNLIPGHGGILDRIDGIIFALPFYYLLIIFNLI